ncbi:Sec-independent protein translocase protein TatB [Helicobacter sp. 13S00477-4]|uniref:Sec-independent protein translocase protein TatB n=1 Tax=Helicobacter sp. 13S00477-4 TaxID=1905759 RepID=UPI000BA5B818
MFGMGIFEILVILIVAVIFLGPEKLPQAMVDVVKFFKAVKKTLNDAKDTFDKELHISEIKQEALEYKSHFEDNFDKVTKDIQLQEIDTMFGEYKEENQTKPKKRTRKSKNQQIQAKEQAQINTPSKIAKKKPSQKDVEATKKDDAPKITHKITPKVGKSTGFKKTSKVVKGS